MSNELYNETATVKFYYHTSINMSSVNILNGNATSFKGYLFGIYSFFLQNKRVAKIQCK